MRLQLARGRRRALAASVISFCYSVREKSKERKGRMVYFSSGEDALQLEVQISDLSAFRWILLGFFRKQFSASWDLRVHPDTVIFERSFWDGEQSALRSLWWWPYIAGFEWCRSARVWHPSTWPSITCSFAKHIALGLVEKKRGHTSHIICKTGCVYMQFFSNPIEYIPIIDYWGV